MHYSYSDQTIWFGTISRRIFVFICCASVSHPLEFPKCIKKKFLAHCAVYSFKVQNLIRNFYEILFFIKYQKYFARLLLLWMTIITLNKIRITMNLLHEICQSFEIQRRSLTFLKRRAEEWNIPFCYFWICKNRKDLKLRKKSSCAFWIVFHQNCLGKFINWRKTKILEILHRKLGY